MQIARQFILPIFLICSSISGFSQFEVQDGPVKIYYPNGQISSEGLLTDGKPSGFWITYYTTGIVKSEGKRTNFVLDSTWNFYNQSGDLSEVINYQLGKKSGYSLKYSYNNPKLPGKATLIAKELYINDKREGYSEYYFNSGELREKVYFTEGKRDGYSREFSEEGTIITLNQYKENYLISRERINRKDAEGNKQGIHKIFYEDGTLKKEENFLDNELHGYFREFDEEGSLLQTMRYERGAVVEEIDEEAQEIIDFRRTFDEEGRIVFSGGYREGVPIGIHRFYDTLGVVINAYIYNTKGVKISEGIVDEQGNRRGSWTDLYETGEVKAKGTYRSNRRSGDWYFYFKDGSIVQRGRFLNGRYDGQWIWYYSDGKVWRDENYFNGREDGYSIEYNTEGEIIEEGTYINGEKDGKWILDVGDHREEGNYIIGLREGKWKYYYLDASLKFEGKYNQGMPDGKQFYFYEDGSLKEEQFFKNGVREKAWKKYDKLGNTLLVITYKNNVEIRINGSRTKLPESDIKVIE